MNKTRLFFCFGILCALQGCAYFIAKIDTPLVEDSYRKNITKGLTYCSSETPTSYQLIGSNQEAQNSYNKLIQKLPPNLDILDHVVLWSLLQLYSRPDQSSPTARLQLILNVEGKTSYFDFFSESTEEQYPYFYGIDWILKKYGKKTSLENYATMLEKNLLSKILVGKDLALFLASQKDAIKKDPLLSGHYVRGTEILSENETLPSFDLRQIIKQYRSRYQDQKIVVNTSLTPYNTGNGHLADCNYDFNLYDNSIFLIDKVIPASNLFGFSKGKSAFLAASSQKLLGTASLHGLPLFKGESKVRSSALCIIEKEGDKIWAFSTRSRDPGQHLFHLIRYGLPNSKSTLEVDKLIKHSRHLFLSDPVRLIIESNRSRPDQIENLLKLNLPIYNADNLGNIWAYTFLNDQSNFLIDDRNNGSFLCK